MATNADRPGVARLEEEEFVRSLVPDPSQPPDARLFVGWAGRSPQQGRWRMYLSPNLDDYLEGDVDDILHHQALPEDRAPLGGTLLWVRRRAEVTRTRRTHAQGQAGFLTGGITSAFFGRPGSSARLPFLAPGTGQEATWTIALITTLFAWAIGTQVSAVLDCWPDPDASAGQCPTGLTHCC